MGVAVPRCEGGLGPVHVVLGQLGVYRGQSGEVFVVRDAEVGEVCGEPVQVHCVGAGVGAVQVAGQGLEGAGGDAQCRFQGAEPAVASAVDMRL